MSRTESYKIICWDMTGTIYDPIRVKTKPGIERLLCDLNERGYINVITSGAKKKDLEDTLDRYQLSKYFDQQFTHKNYSKIGDFYRMTHGQVERNMLVIGDSDQDAPFDTNAVFIHHPQGVSEDSLCIEEAINLLESKDKRGFCSALSVLYTEAVAAQKGIPQMWLPKSGRRVEFKRRDSFGPSGHSKTYWITI